MIVLPRWPGTRRGWKAMLQPKGTWYPYPLGPITMPGEHLRRGVRIAVYIICPECDRALELSSKVHRVAADGSASPSLVCPYDRHGCRWHVFARLAEW